MTRRASADAPAGDVDEPAAGAAGTRRGSQAMLRAVNRDRRRMGGDLGDTALAELARQLARRFDSGDDKATAQLRATLGDLQRLSRAPAPAPVPPSGSTAAGSGDESGGNGSERGTNATHGADPLEKIRQDREVRRSKMGGRGPNGSPNAPDMVGSEPESAT